MTTRLYLTIAALLVALLTPSIAAAAPAVNCTKINAYRVEVAEVLRDSDVAGVMEEMEDMDGADLMTLTPRTLKRYGKAFTTLAEDLEDIDPPAGAEDFHDAMIDTFVVFGMLFTTASQSSMLGAAMVYGDLMEETQDTFDDELAALEKACPVKKGQSA